MTLAVDRPQHIAALELANRVRLGRAKLKREIMAGATDPVKVLRDPPECARSMSVAELLAAQRRWGRARTRRLLVTVQVSETRRVGELTDRERRVLAAALEGRR